MREDVLKLNILSKDKIAASWTLSNQRLDFVVNYFGKPFTSFRTALRIYDITDLNFNGNNAHHFHGFMMKQGQNAWDIKGLNPNRHYCLELGIHLSETEFFPLLRSISFNTRNENVSKAIDKKTKIDSRQSDNQSLPKWSDHVSTYSYYETAVPKGDGK
ncbi:DUF4912 domain-containing protein [Bacillus marasmi]|uniref:DUF4912 domain-containing protein n=1 Tax=Bacillus marasmi TaxID=1926279 RepID=UPI0011C99D08|nr:DUF4912 domain-containing protein [Bacillus marasmi]